MSYKVLARTHRPQRFNALVGQEVVGRTLANAISRNRVHHAYLFCGPRGVGKTSAARILAMALNCEQGPVADPCGTCSPCLEVAAGRSLDVQEIDGASHNGVDHVRQLQETAYTRPALRCRIFIIDEVHMLTNQAFNALLKLLEEPPASVHFIFATTEPHKVLDTIKSRCQRHDFRRIPTRRIIEQLSNVCQLEELDVAREALRLIAVAAEGGMRDALSLLEQVIAYTGGAVDGILAAECLGLVDRRAVLALLEALRAEDRAAALEQLDHLYSAGSDLRRFADALVAEVRALVVCHEVAEPQSFLDLDSDALQHLRQLGQGMDPAHLRRWLRIALDAAAEINRSGHPRTVLELAILRMADAAGAQSLSQLLNHLQGGAPPPRQAVRPASEPPRQAVRPASEPPRQAVRPASEPPRRSHPGGQAGPQAPSRSAQALGLRQEPNTPPPSTGKTQQPNRQNVQPVVTESVPSAPFLHAVARSSQPLAATLALAGLRLRGLDLVGRLDEARLAILRQERSKQDIAMALAEAGLSSLHIGEFHLNAATTPPPPQPTQSGAPQTQPSSPPSSSPQPPKQQPSAASPAKVPAKPNASNLHEQLPELDEQSRGLIVLWSAIFPQLPDTLKGRLVPFAPVVLQGDQLILATETEGLIDSMTEALASLTLEHDQVKTLSAQVVAADQRPVLRSMLRQMRADRDPVFREKLSLREHETTQAVMDLFGATVDEVGL